MSLSYKKIKRLVNGTTETTTFQPNQVAIRRQNPIPLDSTDIFLNYLSAVQYAQGNLELYGATSMQPATAAYPGKTFTVLSINNDDTDSTATMYQIQNSAGDLKKILTEPFAGIEFDFGKYSLGQILEQVISSLGGTVKKDS